jgi:signal transduction histidine kinase
MMLNRLGLLLILTIIFFCSKTSLSQSVSIVQDSSQIVNKAKYLLQQFKNNPNYSSDAINKLNELLLVCEKENAIDLQIEILQAQLKIAQQQANYSLQREKLFKLEGLFEQLKDPLNKAQVAYQIAKTYHTQGYQPGAINYYFQSLKLFEILGNENGQLVCYTALGDVYARMKLFSKSIEYNLKGLKLVEQKKDKFAQVLIVENLATIYHNQRNPKKSFECLVKTYQLYADIGNKAGESNALLKMAQNAAEENAFKKSKQLFEKSLQIALSINAKPLIAQNYNGLAAIAIHEKLYVDAGTYFKKTIDIAKPLGLNIQLEEAYQGLSSIYKSLNDESKARAFSALSKEISDSIYNDSILKKAADLQLMYESEKKQNEIELYKKNSLVNDLNYKKEKQLRYFFTALSALLVVLFGVVFLFYHQNKRNNQQLNNQNEELLIKNISIEQQSEQLGQLNEVKDRFYAIVSHDLRNNLSTMKLYFDLISNPQFNPENQKELTREIAYSVQNTIDLLENLLVWASSQLKGISIQATAVDLFEISNNTIELINGAANQKNIQVINCIPAGTSCFGDKNMIELVMRNLISNAVKFTTENGQIQIKSSIDDSIVCFSVIDNGVGIEPNKIESLFDAYKNSSTKGTGNEQGTGLGLMLCKLFVEENKGKISVVNNIDGGACFTVCLPRINT